MAKRIFTILIIVSLVIPLTISCQSCPEEISQNNLELSVPTIPEPYLIPIVELTEAGILVEYYGYKEFLISVLNYYTVYYQLLLTMEASGQYLEADIKEEKEFCESVIDWISINLE